MMDLIALEHSFERVYNIGPNVTCVPAWCQEYQYFERDLLQSGIVKRVHLVGSFSSPPYEANLWIFRADISARIVGRNGCVVNAIKAFTKTEIWSPRVMNRSDNRIGEINGYFKISGARPIDTLLTMKIIVRTGFDFLLQYVVAITPMPGQVREEVEVEPNLVPKILQNRGRKVIDIQEAATVKIVSPKPYSPPCKFYILGNAFNVILAKLMMYDLINEIRPLRLRI